MTAVHPFENPVIEGLDPHADSRDSEVKECGNIFIALFHNVFRVGLDGELAQRSGSLDAPDSSHDTRQNIRRKHRWGASSDVESAERIAPDFFFSFFRFSQDCVGIFIEQLALTAFAARLRIEAAIGAETPAEGDVKVNHLLSEQKFCLAQEGLGGVSLDSVDARCVGRNLVEVDAQLDFLALIVYLAGSGCHH